MTCRPCQMSPSPRPRWGSHSAWGGDPILLVRYPVDIRVLCTGPWEREVSQCSLQHLCWKSNVQAPVAGGRTLSDQRPQEKRVISDTCKSRKRLSYSQLLQKASGASGHRTRPGCPVARGSHRWLPSSPLAVHRDTRVTAQLDHNIPTFCGMRAWANRVIKLPRRLQAWQGALGAADLQP